MIGWRLSFIWLILATSVSASDTETAVYKYDALGRLVGNCSNGGPSDGLKTAVGYDAADNRLFFDVARRAFALTAGNGIHSPDGRFYLVMQSDGNFVLYGPSGALWATYAGTSGNFVQFQSDGNLVVYNSASAPIWSSGTAGQVCARLAVQNDGNVVIYNDDGAAVWATNTGGH